MLFSSRRMTGMSFPFSMGIQNGRFPIFAKEARRARPECLSRCGRFPRNAFFALRRIARRWDIGMSYVGWGISPGGREAVNGRPPGDGFGGAGGFFHARGIFLRRGMRRRKGGPFLTRRMRRASRGHWDSLHGRGSRRGRLSLPSCVQNASRSPRAFCLPSRSPSCVCIKIPLMH